jgi:hypothetical protein
MINWTPCIITSPSILLTKRSEIVTSCSIPEHQEPTSEIILCQAEEERETVWRTSR